MVFSFFLRVTAGFEDESARHVGAHVQPDRSRSAHGGRGQVEETGGRDRARVRHGRRGGQAAQRVARSGHVSGPRGHQAPPEPQQQLHGRAAEAGQVELQTVREHRVDAVTAPSAEQLAPPAPAAAAAAERGRRRWRWRPSEEQ